MKKQILHSLLVAVSITVAGCSKEVKSPSKSSNSTTLKMSSAPIPSTDTNGHTCGGNNQSSNNSATY